MLEFKDGRLLRQRVVLSILSGKEMRISNIHRNSKNMQPGIRPYEANFLKLINGIMDGTKINLDPTGTVLVFKPGVLCGVSANKMNKCISSSGYSTYAASSLMPYIHMCNPNKNISYYLEPLLLLCAFSKYQMNVIFGGVTDAHDTDISVDELKTTYIPFIDTLMHVTSQNHRLISETIDPLNPDENENISFVNQKEPSGAEIKVLCRGIPGAPYGLVSFKGVRIRRSYNPYKLNTCMQRIKRIRGSVFCVGLSPSFGRKVVSAARGVLNDLLPDVWIYMEQQASAKSQKRQINANTPIDMQTDAQTHQGAVLSKLKQQQIEKMIASKVKGLGITLTAECLTGACRSFSKGLVMSTGKTQTNDSLNSGGGPISDSCIDDLIKQNKGSLLAKKDEINNSNNGINNEDLCIDAADVLGINAARGLLLNILQGGAIQPQLQQLALLFAAVADDYSSSELLLSPLTPSSIEFIRNLRDFFSVVFKFEEIQNKPPKFVHPHKTPSNKDENNYETKGGKYDISDFSTQICNDGGELLDKILPNLFLAKCVGIGLKNIAMKSF